MIPIPLWREFITTLHRALPVFAGWLVQRAWRDRLPARTRLRHRAAARADRAGWWLMEHDHYTAASLLWRALGVW